MSKMLQSGALVTVVWVMSVFAAVPAAIKHKKGRTSEIFTQPILWRKPIDINKRNLYYGIGGKRDAPSTTAFVFVKEDLKGTNPKYVVRDASGNRWKVKLGPEARPETAAARLLWAVGYYTNEDYFLSKIRIENLPANLKRGRQYIRPGGVVYSVRLKRHLRHEKKIGDWHWRQNRFSGTRELYGLRVMMAVLNDWDLKDSNNSMYRPAESRHSKDPAILYMVSDLGSTLGTSGQSWTDRRSKGNLKSFRRSKFISRVTADYVDFDVPTRPALDYLLLLPVSIPDIREHWIGRHIPQADARWVGRLLALLSPHQVSEAFKAAGYSPADVQGYTAVIEARIAELNRL